MHTQDFLYSNVPFCAAGGTLNECQGLKIADMLLLRSLRQQQRLYCWPTAAAPSLMETRTYKLRVHISGDTLLPGSSCAATRLTQHFMEPKGSLP
jgi:hypothetical protein